MACSEHPAGQRHEIAPSKVDCRCQMGSAHVAPVAVPIGVVSPGDGHALVAILPAATPKLPVPAALSEPGIFGVDSGPPLAAEHPRDSGRAPPVARV